MSKYTKNIVVCLNKFSFDTRKEINYVKSFVENMGYPIEICDSYKKGGKGAKKLAQKIVEICNNKIDYKPLYNYDDSIIDKINKISKEIYRSDKVIINDDVKEKIKNYENMEFGNLPVCIAKTQYSFTDDPKKLGAPVNFDMTVTDVRISSGAGFIVVLMGNIMTMPGLGKASAYLNMDIDTNSKITGLF